MGDIRGGEVPVISGNLLVGWNCVTVKGGLKVCIDCVAMGDTKGNKDGGRGPRGGCVNRFGKVVGITGAGLGNPILKFGKPMKKLIQVTNAILKDVSKSNYTLEIIITQHAPTYPLVAVASEVTLWYFGVSTAPEGVAKSPGWVGDCLSLVDGHSHTA